MRKTSGRRGILRTALDAVITARQREADRYVRSMLLSLDDDTLAAHGYSRRNLKQSTGSAFIY